MPRLAALAVALAVALAACRTADEPRSPLCASGSAAVERALSRAPGPVRLADGARLSECVARSRTDAELQEIGVVLTRAAEHLAAPARRRRSAAVALGYLVGAARRGAARTSGVHAELVRRLEQSAAFLESSEPPLRAALHRGLAAGRASG